MLKLNEVLKNRCDVSVLDIAKIAQQQQSNYQILLI